MLLCVIIRFVSICIYGRGRLLLSESREFSEHHFILAQLCNVHYRYKLTNSRHWIPVTMLMKVKKNWKISYPPTLNLLNWHDRIFSTTRSPIPNKSVSETSRKGAHLIERHFTAHRVVSSHTKYNFYLFPIRNMEILGLRHYVTQIDYVLIAEIVSFSIHS